MNPVGASSSTHVGAFGAAELDHSGAAVEGANIAALDFTFAKWAGQAGAISITDQGGASVEALTASVLDRLLAR